MRKEMRQTNPAALIISRRVHRIRRTRRLLLRPHLGTPDTTPTFEDPASEAHSAASGHPTVDRTQDAGPGIPRHLQQALLIIGDTGLIPAIRLVKRRCPLRQIIVLLPIGRQNNGLDCALWLQGRVESSESVPIQRRFRSRAPQRCLTRSQLGA